MNADLIGAMEARLIAVERRTVRLEDETRGLKRGVGLAQQQTWESWADFRGRGIVPTTPTVVATAFSGTVTGCTNGTLAATSLTLRVAGGGATLWTGSAPTGTFSGTAFLSASTAVEMVVVPTSTHMATTVVSLGTMVPGSTYSFVGTAAGPASGYICYLQSCSIAYNSTVTVSDNHFADSTVLTWNGSTSWDGTAAAAPTRAYSLFPNGTLRCFYSLSPPQFIVPTRTTSSCTPRWTMPSGTAPTWAVGNTLDVTDTP